MPGLTGTAARRLAKQAEVHLSRDARSVHTSCPRCGVALEHPIPAPGVKTASVITAANRLRRNLIDHLTLDGCTTTEEAKHGGQDRREAPHEGLTDPYAGITDPRWA